MVRRFNNNFAQNNSGFAGHALRSAMKKLISALTKAEGIQMEYTRWHIHNYTKCDEAKCVTDAFN